MRFANTEPYSFAAFMNNGAVANQSIIPTISNFLSSGTSMTPAKVSVGAPAVSNSPKVAMILKMCFTGVVRLSFGSVY